MTATLHFIKLKNWPVKSLIIKSLDRLGQNKYKS